MVTISRAEYEAMQAKLTMQNQQLAQQDVQLAEQNQQLEAKSAELAQALLQNQWLTEQLLVKKRKIFGSSSGVLDQMVMKQFAHLFNEAECWDAAGQKPAAKALRAGSMQTATKGTTGCQRRSGWLDALPMPGVNLTKH